MDPPANVEDVAIPQNPKSPARPQLRSPTYVVALTIISVFLIQICDYMMRAPLTRILESIICRQYWDLHDPGRFQGDVDEKWCKAASIQGSISMLKGWDVLLSCIPEILLSIPMGILADKYGRKKLLFVSLLGMCLSTLTEDIAVYFNNIFDVRWIWANNLFLFLGGGATVANNMYSIILADVTSEETRAAAFFRKTAASLSSSIIAVPLAWYLMRINVWLPIWVALGFMLAGTFVTLLLPETLNYREDDPTLEPLLDNTEECPEVFDIQSKRLLNHVINLPSQLKFVVASPIITILALSFLVNSLGHRTLSLILQFASKRFEISLASASFLLPISSTINFILLCFVLPYIGNLLTVHYHYTPPQKDLSIARISIILIVVGLFGIGISPHISLLILSVVVDALGVGYTGANMSLITGFVKRHEVGRLYSILGILDMTGRLIGGPVLSKLFSLGLDMGGLWSGLPFFIAAGLFGAAGTVIWVIRLPGTEWEAEDAQIE